MSCSVKACIFPESERGLCRQHAQAEESFLRTKHPFSTALPEKYVVAAGTGGKVYSDGTITKPPFSAHKATLNGGTDWTPLVAKLTPLKDGEYIDVPLERGEPSVKFANRVRSMLNMRKDTMYVFWSVTQNFKNEFESSSIRVTRVRDREPSLYSQLTATREVTKTTTETTKEAVSIEIVTPLPPTIPSTPIQIETVEPARTPPPPANVLPRQLSDAISNYPEDKVRALADAAVGLASTPLESNEWEPFLERQNELGEQLMLHRKAKAIVDQEIATWASRWWDKSGTKPDDGITAEQDDYGREVAESIMNVFHQTVVKLLTAHEEDLLKQREELQTPRKPATVS